MYHVIQRLVALIVAIPFAISNAAAIDVYLFKGAGDFSFISENMHFSRGLDRIADQLRQDGIYVEVRRFGETADALRSIRERMPQSVAFIGHSMGALAAMNMARKMRTEGVTVAYVATLDIPGPIGTAGSNVQWAENYYSMTPVFGLLTNVKSHPRAENIFVFGRHHAILDDAKKVRNGILNAIREIHAAEQNNSIMLPESQAAADLAPLPPSLPAAPAADSWPVTSTPFYSQNALQPVNEEPAQSIPMHFEDRSLAASGKSLFKKIVSGFAGND